MKCSVYISRRASMDLISLHECLAANHSPARADAVVLGIEQVCWTLVEFPNRGRCPPELEGRQRTDLRELRFKAYRILYRVQPSRIDVLAVFDGRCDARDLIEQRLLRGGISSAPDAGLERD